MAACSTLSPELDNPNDVDVAELLTGPDQLGVEAVVTRELSIGRQTIYG